MPQGIETVVEGEYATIGFSDKSLRGETLRRLNEITTDVRVDTGGTRRTYVVPVEAAREAGLVDAASESAAPQGSTDTEPPEFITRAQGVPQEYGTGKPDTIAYAEAAKAEQSEEPDTLTGVVTSPDDEAAPDVVVAADQAKTEETDSDSDGVSDAEEAARSERAKRAAATRKANAEKAKAAADAETTEDAAVADAAAAKDESEDWA